MRLALAQLDPVVGDIDGNRKRIVSYLARARAAAADLVVFPELAVTGYPPEDLLLRPGFLRAAESSLAQIAAEARGIVALIGTPRFEGDLYNACAVCAEGEIKDFYRKRFLPNYGVFDEERYFASASDLIVLELAGTKIGVTICEDMWQPGPPASELAMVGAELIVNLSASPFYVGRDRLREEMFRSRARDLISYIAFCNLVGGQDELVFDGHSMVADHEGELIARAAGFAEELLIVDIAPESVISRRLSDVRGRALARRQPPAAPTRIELAAATQSERPALERAPLVPFADDLEQMRRALVLGLGDYMRKNGFSEVVIGVSGGIDSALTAALAVETLGAERVHCVSMPSRFSSPETKGDAGRLAESLGTDFTEIDIEPMVASFESALVSSFAGLPRDLAEENVQARVRGTLLMALSNKHGWLLVATGNKSELSVGYATLYGDMAGGFALLKDVFKTDVFRLSRYLNESADRELIPASIIERPPSAELRSNQLDEDSLPPYSELDRVLEAYVENDRSRDDLLSDGFDPAVVERAIALVDRAEYKRRQAPPGVKLRSKAFGRDRRTPITSGWRD